MTAFEKESINIATTAYHRWRSGISAGSQRALDPEIREHSSWKHMVNDVRLLIRLMCDRRSLYWWSERRRPNWSGEEVFDAMYLPRCGDVAACDEA